jgi:hypothetical protein
MAAPGLLALASSKGLSEELLLGIGEAAAAAAGDVSGFDPQLLLWSNMDSLADCVDAAAAATTGPEAAGAPVVANGGPQQPHAAAMDVDSAGAAGASRGSNGRSGVQEYLLAELGKMAVSPKEEVRCAAAAAAAAGAALCLRRVRAVLL